MAEPGATPTPITAADVRAACRVGCQANPQYTRCSVCRAADAIDALLIAYEQATREKDRNQHIVNACAATECYGFLYRDEDHASLPEWKEAHMAIVVEQRDMLAGLRKQLADVTRAREEAEALAERLKLEAQIHAQEARTQKATVLECYRAVTEGRGEPADWNGSRPVVEALASLRQQLSLSEQQVETLKRAVYDVLEANTRLSNELEAAEQRAQEMRKAIDQSYAEMVMAKEFLYKPGTDPEAWMDSVMRRLSAFIASPSSLPERT